MGKGSNNNSSNVVEPTVNEETNTGLMGNQDGVTDVIGGGDSTPVSGTGISEGDSGMGGTSVPTGDTGGGTSVPTGDPLPPPPPFSSSWLKSSAKTPADFVCAKL